MLEAWMQSYRPEELFDARGALRPELAALAPAGDRRMGANPHANGGLPAARPPHARFPRRMRSRFTRPGAVDAEDTRVLGRFLRDVDPAATRRRATSGSSVRTRRCRTGSTPCSRPRAASGKRRHGPDDQWLAPDGRVLEVLSEHQCQGWLEGYLLTGRHGLFNTYEAFAHIVDSMFNQHAKWLKVTRGLPWRRPIASLNYLLASHVWRQDHNGFTHQDPGFIDHARQQEGRGRARLSAAGRQLPAERDGPLPAQPALRQHRRRRQAPGAAVADDGRGRAALHGGHRHLGLGQQRRRRRAGSRDGARRAMCRRSRRWPRSRSCASIFRS